MAGLVGFTGAPGAGAEREATLLSLRGTISHRAFYTLDSLFRDDRICASGSQLGVFEQSKRPHSDYGMHLWLDGEFSNRRELRQRLAHVAESDAAILLGLLRECFERDELSLLSKIDGIYAAVLYEPQRAQLHLLNDRYGARALYWGRFANELVWTSEQKALPAIVNGTDSIDAAAVTEFLETGGLSGTRSWFPGLQRLAPATLLSWDLGSKRHREREYWSPQQIAPALAPFDEKELTAEIGRRFERAVRLRAPTEERIGVRLDGGFATRALLAGVPERATPLSVTTFGNPQSEDVEIAKRAAALRSTQQRVYELDDSNWLDSRLSGVWWADGLQSVFEMHDAAALSEPGERGELLLSDFGAGLLQDRFPGLPHYQPCASQVQFERRFPFLANDFVELVASLPPELRAGTRLFERFLLERWPDYFSRLPRQPGDSPINAPLAQRLVTRMFSRLRAGRRPVFDYPSLIRRGRARECFQDLLLAREAAVLAFVERPVIESLWHQQLAGADHSQRLGRLLTLELWLNQLLRGRYRPTRSERQR